MPNTKITIVKSENGTEVTIENFEGLTMMDLERFHFAVLKKYQQVRAQALNEMHKADAKKREMEALLSDETENANA